MLLQVLTPAERAFLTGVPAAPCERLAWLTHRLAATLSARLRLRVGLEMRRTAVPARAPRIPEWQVDAPLAALWLTRRLGGRPAGGVAPFVPRGLLQTLDATLAESWLDGAAERTLPTAIAWEVRAGAARAGLVLHLPAETASMMRWAQEAIRRG